MKKVKLVECPELKVLSDRDAFKLLGEGYWLGIPGWNDVIGLSEEGKLVRYYKDTFPASFSGDPAILFKVTNCSSFAVYKVEETQWYDDIPEQGVLCWVSDYDRYKKDQARVILNYLKDSAYPFYASNKQLYKFATPVTEEELKDLIYKP